MLVQLHPSQTPSIVPSMLVEDWEGCFYRVSRISFCDKTERSVVHFSPADERNFYGFKLNLNSVLSLIKDGALKVVEGEKEIPNGGSKVEQSISLHNKGFTCEGFSFSLIAN